MVPPVSECQTLGRLKRMMPRRFALRGRLFFMLLLLWGGFAFHSGAEAAQPPMDLAELNWEYRWGDLPLTDTRPDFSSVSSQWQPIAYPANPPERDEQQYVWFRTVLPEADLSEPVIFITSINLNVEAYLDDQLIHRFGELAQDEKKRFMGWPWHQINLPEDFAGKTLYLRVYSDYTDIGLWGEAKLMERSNMLLHVISSGLHELIVAAFSLLVAFVALVFALFRGTKKEFFYLGLFSLATAGVLIGENLAIQLVIQWPLVKTYLAAVSYFAMPIFIAMLLYYWLNGAKGSRLLKFVAQLHFVYLTVAVLLSLTGVVNLAIFFPIFDALFVLSLLIMMRVVLQISTQVNYSQQLVLGAFAVYAIFLLVDMLVAHSFLPWVDFPIAIGGLLFALVLVVISIRSYVHTNLAMEQLNQQLEQRVIERTAELHAYVDAEQKRRRELERENQFSAELEKFNVALQSCQNLDEAKTLMREKLSGVFSPTRVQVSLDGDIINTLPDAQIRLQQLEGGSHVLASLTLDGGDEVLSKDRLADFIRRASQRLTVTLGNIKLREDLQRYSFEDSLTGLRNRRFFDDALARDIQLAKRNQTPLSLLVCDIDHFKRFNDEFGHDAGDAALQAVAETLQQYFRESDIPCRFGGEEFVVLMRDAEPEDARAKAEKLKEAVQALDIRYRGEKLSHLTISIGIASLTDRDMDAETLLRQADQALYAAKQGGRNRVVSHNEQFKQSQAN
ncbi:MAG: diguanylate cyclase [Methylophaga sp.]|nr:diguanylate cyclase [Methylophaga sp.]